MAVRNNNTQFVSHKKSKLKETNGKPKLPSALDIVEGEIAINFAKDVETLSIKNESGDVVTFSSDNYYSEQKLGSAFTGANSAVTVTDYINSLDMGNEVEVNSGNTPTGETIELWVDESVEPVIPDVYSKEQVDTLLEGKLDEDVFESYSGTVIEQIGERALQGDLNVLSGITTAHTANTDIHVTASDKTAWDAKLDSSDVDQVIDSTTSASTDPVSTSAVYDFVEQVKQDFDGALDDLSDKIDEHSGDTVMHITSAERTAWDNKVDASDLNGYADAVTYNSTTHYVEFYHGTTAGTKVFEYDAAPFIIDGMVDNVEIADVSGTTCLVISFNTDAGKQDINIPVSEIFDADEYYTKDEIDEADEIVAAALNDLEERKMDVSGMTNYYTKSETSGASEISSAIVDMTILNTDLRHDFSTHSADTTMHFSEGEKAIFTDLTKNAEYYSGITSADTTNWDNKQDQLVSGTNIKTINNESILGSGNIDIVLPDELWVSGTGENAVVLKNSSGTASGDYSVAEGAETIASGGTSHAEGYKTSATTYQAHTEGKMTLASGMRSHAEGLESQAIGEASHAEGYATTASGDSSHAEGWVAKAIGDISHAEGSWTNAIGNYSHVEGLYTTASGMTSHAEGSESQAIGESSHAEGQATFANGDFSHAEGASTLASGDSSHAEGSYTIANNYAEHASGIYNASHVDENHEPSGSTLFSVGNGHYDATEDVEVRHNAFEIRQNGDIYITSGSSDIKLQDYLGGGSGTVDQVIDSGTSASTNAVSTSAVYGFVTSYTPSITVDQDFSNTASTNPISTQAVYSAVTDNELVWTNAFVTLSGTVSAHTIDTNIHITSADRAKLDSITGTFGTMAYENKTSYSSATEVNTALGNKAETTALTQVNSTLTAHTADTTIHVTAADKTAWNAKVDASAIADFFDDAKYEDSGTTKVINFYHGNTIKATIDASDFIVDGMVDDVRIEDVAGSGTCLVIDFNTASGKQDINIPLTQIFDPSNYYNKAAIDTLVGSGFTSSSITDVIIENEQIVSAALTDLDERKLDASAYTPTDLSNYYTKSETSGSSEISTALAAKTDTATTTALNNVVTGHTANTSIHLSSTEKTNLDSLETNIAAISGITSTKVGNWDGAATNSHTHSNKSVLDGISSSDITNWNGKTSNVGTVTNVQLSLPTGLSASTTAITSSGTFDIALSNGYSIPTTTKQGQWDTAYTNNHTHGNKSALDSITGSVGSMAYENTSSYSSATQVNTALEGKSNTGHTHTKSEITDFPSSMPASDVYSWAKAENKPTYTYSEVGAAAASHNHDDRYYTESELTGSSTTVVVAKAASATTAASATNAGYATSAGSAPASDVYSWAKASSKPSYSASEITGLGNSATLNTGTTAGTVAAGDHTHSISEITNLQTTLDGKVNTGVTISAGTGLSGGGDLSTNRTISLAMPTTYSAETYTSSTITSSEPVVYALVRYTGTTALANQVCPVTLADGQQCNVIYQSANNNAYDAAISTDYVEPDGQQITLNVPAGGYAEINYINIKGIIFVRGI